MTFFSFTILAVHYLLIAILCAFGAHRLFLTIIAMRSEPADTRAADRLANREKIGDDDLPLVTVQAPIFNEKFVVARLIDALAALDYPRDKLQIQIVDDSTDDTAEIAAAAIARHAALGVNISHIHRTDRAGYKAGALQNALDTATGELIAIFDADFIPYGDFLRQTVPSMMSDSRIGMAQTRWQHLNVKTNLLTRVQSIILDAHFAIEQVARFRGGVYFNFNGTGGIWRKQAIIDAGGWRADTLTEDLDLSYRAQMKGWRFIYLRDVGCPSELPTDMRAFKTQQHRWAKGAIEVMKKLLIPVWRSDAHLAVKAEASFHLMSNISYTLMLIDSLFFLLPSIYIREQAGLGLLTWLDIPLFFLASGSHAIFFIASQKILYGKITNKASLLPGLLATSIGLSVNNGRAVIEAAVGHITGFVRTPKTGDISSPSGPVNQTVSDGTGTGVVMGPRDPANIEATGANGPARPGNTYAAISAQWAEALELFLAFLYGCYLFWAISQGYWIVTPFLALFMIGFLFVGLGSIAARLRNRAETPLAHASPSLS